jgi:hypothetical protein
MAAIQQIQNLIALSQPIPPDLQIAALLEAQQQGLSSSALAGVFGVPESMIGDAVSALGLSSQLSPELGGTLVPVVAPVTNQDSLFNDILTANNIIGSIGDIYGNASVAPAASVSNQGYQSPYALNAAEQPSVNLGQVAGGTNTALQGLADFNIADSAGSAAAASDVFAGGLGSIIGAISGKESKAESAGLAVLSMFNPAAALAYRIFDALDFFGGGRSKATPMTPEEALKYAGESRLATTLQSQGEGAAELILDAVEQARAANVEPEKIAEALNDSDNPVAGLINLTVGSNKMLSDADLAEAQAATAPSSAAEGGGQEEETVDLGADTTANELLTGGLGDADTGGVADVNETWTYDKDTDSFISNTRGDVFSNRGNATLKDGGVYAVTPVLGTDGVTAENVVDTETNESVGILNVDITTGLPSIIKTVDAGSSVNNNNTGGS